VLAMMAQITGYAIEVRRNPALVRAREVTRLVGDNARLDGLGVHPSIPLAETLAWMFGER
jgi:hypothetical protein